MAVTCYVFGIVPIYSEKFIKSNNRFNSEDAENGLATGNNDNSNETESKLRYEKTLRKVSRFSNGLLVGTALSLIIPEGINTLFDKHDEKPNYDSSKSVILTSMILVGFLVMYLVDNYKILSAPEGIVDPEEEAQKYKQTCQALRHADLNNDYQNSLGIFGYNATVDIQFFFRNSRTASLQSFMSFTKKFLPNLKGTFFIFHKLILHETILIGLLVHSVADGIAFGTSALVENNNLKVLVFLSCIIHKFPASFALGGALLEKYHRLYLTSENINTPAFNSNFNPNINNDDNLPRNADETHKVITANIDHIVKTEVLLFSISASVSAIVTYLFAGIFVSSTHIYNFVGALLLFSGGSFLYVAVHLFNDANAHHNSNLESENDETVMVEGDKRPDLALTIWGMTVPLLVGLFLKD